MKFINHTFKIKKHIVNNDKDINKQIVLLSDIHYSLAFKKEKTTIIVNKLKELKPDYICITGDIIDNAKIPENKELKKEIIKFLTEVSSITKTFACIGNHDQFVIVKRSFASKVKFDENKTWFEELKKINNFELLDNAKYVDDNICFYGITLSPDYYFNEPSEDSGIVEDLNTRLPKIENKYNILLIHSPIHVLNEKTIVNTDIKSMNLILSGHTHNGVVPPILDSIFKGNKGIYSPNGTWFLKTKFCRGRYDLDDKTLIINGGITKIHDSSLKFLVSLNELFPMSLDVIELKSIKK